MWKILFIICSLSFEIKADVYNDVKNSRNFTGKVVLVTGSTSGMGESVAKLFSSLGAKVVVTGRNKIQLEKAGNEVSELSPHGLKVNSFQLN
jgi:NADP-dependent 3-hydroxy acid dehydrogenase YdfG